MFILSFYSAKIQTQGFAVTYSVLFAKIWRVQKLYNLAAKMRRQTVTYKDVYFIIAIVLSAEIIVLIAMQIVSPHIWQRDVVQDMSGYSIESIGSCDSEIGWWFFAALVGMNVLCLFVALILCWRTKDIPSDFAESNYIFLSVMFMFQILLLAVPVSAMVRDDNNVFFFIRVAAVFMQNFTVLVLIFVPKMRRIYVGEDTAESVRIAMRQSISTMNGRNSIMDSGSMNFRHLGAERTNSKTASVRDISKASASANRSQFSSAFSSGVSANNHTVPIRSVVQLIDETRSNSFSGPFSAEDEKSEISKSIGKSGANEEKETDEENRVVAVDEQNVNSKRITKKRVNWTDSAASKPVNMIDFPGADE